ncbi:hypothetical protein JW756_06560 [Candidatus Woesearchaeota archaeon]|nr:hypothetical protein [Candidatus Woesearchaeota archaeon]
MWELKKEIENRKENLIYTLKNKKEFLELEKQHQIYGAIKELNHVLEMMEQFREEEMLAKPRQLELNLNEASGGDEEEIKAQPTAVQKQSVIRVVGEKVRKIKSPIKIRFAKNGA